MKEKQLISLSKTQRVAIIGCILLVALVFIIAKVRNDRLYNNFELTEGRIVKVTYGQSKTLQFKMDGYKPKYNPSIGIGYKCRNLVANSMNELTKFKFPVIYEKGNRANHQILLFEKQYKKAKIKIPDSLKQVVKKLSECGKYNY